MKSIRFLKSGLPHVVAIVIFLLVTVSVFSPVFFDNKVLEQYDIQQFVGSAKTIQDYRNATGEEALWADAMFSGMPAYLISVKWGNESIAFINRVFSLGLPHPISKIFLSFICYYVMLLVFGIRPYLAIAGAIAFGMSSYMMFGLIAGHNGRVGAIAFMPLVIAGVQLVFTNRRILGTGLTTAAVALELRENHMQITYYLFIIISVYLLAWLIESIRNKTVGNFAKSLGIVFLAALVGICTFFGQLWAISEYTVYSTRGKSELNIPPSIDDGAAGISRRYAFEYSNGIFEPLTVLIPNFYGGASSDYLVSNRESETHKVLASRGDEQMLNQLARYTSAYWGPQYDTTSGTAPYYGGAIIVFLFGVGIAFAEKRNMWWLVSTVFIGIALSWGKNFFLNDLLFEYLPGYSKFRSVTFALIIALFSMPLLGLLGIERLWHIGLNGETKRRLVIVFGSTAGFCLILGLFSSLLPLTNDSELQLPSWLLSAMKDDRQRLLRSDALRSFVFITIAFILIYFEVNRRISVLVFSMSLFFLIVIDLTVVNKRYLTKDRFKPQRERAFTAMTEADHAIVQDKTYHRVYNLAFLEAKTSYHHYSIGGYHGAKLRRYQEFYDSCLYRQTQEFISRAKKGDLNMENYGAFNMLNVKYIVFGEGKENVIPNYSANGNGWFVNEVIAVKSATEALQMVCSINTRSTAVIEGEKLDARPVNADTVSGTIQLLEHTPRALKYESKSKTGGLAIFSEIYYPKGWTATIDGRETPVLRANFILRALQVPAGNHTIQFRFEPSAYVIGNKITAAASWLVFLILLGSVGLTIKERWNRKST